MNLLLHILINYFIINSVFGNAQNYFVYIIIFSTILDLDHIPYIMTVRGDLVKKKFGSASRTRFHELYGLSILSIVISLTSLFAGIQLLKVIALCLVMHMAADFLVGHSRPFYPFSKKEVFLGLCPVKYRMGFEILLTGLLVLVLWSGM